MPSRITRDHPVDTMVQGWKISCQPRTRRDGIELQRQRFSAQKRSYCFLGQSKQFVFSYFYCPRTPSATFSQLTTATMGVRRTLCVLASPATLLLQLALRASGVCACSAGVGKFPTLRERGRQLENPCLTAERSALGFSAAQKKSGAFFLASEDAQEGEDLLSL